MGATLPADANQIMISSTDVTLTSFLCSSPAGSLGTTVVKVILFSVAFRDVNKVAGW